MVVIDGTGTQEMTCIQLDSDQQHGHLSTIWGNTEAQHDSEKGFKIDCFTEEWNTFNASSELITNL